MAEKKSAKKATDGFTEEERAAARDRVRELRAQKGSGKATGEEMVQAKIAEMQGSDRVIAQRLHALIKAHAPTLTTKTWYGMPAYVKGEEVLCWFQPAGKFKVRYAFLGFSDEAHLDEGRMWPISFALTELGAPEEARIVALLKKALG